MKTLTEVLQKINESILDTDAINDKVKNDVEWRDMLLSATQKLIKSLKIQDAWAFEVARYKVAQPLFMKYQSAQTPGPWAERFAAFMEHTLNPFTIIDYDVDDIDSLYNFERVCWEKTPQYQKNEFIKVCQEIINPKNDYRKRAGSSGSFYEYFFPYELREVYMTWSMMNRSLVTKYQTELSKLAKIVGIDK